MYLSLAGVLEVTWATGLKFSHSFSRHHWNHRSKVNFPLTTHHINTIEINFVTAFIKGVDTADILLRRLHYGNFFQTMHN